MNFLILSMIILAVAGIEMEQRKCRYTFRNVNHLTIENVDTSEDIESESTVHGSNQTCSKATNYCYALWKEDSHNGTASNVTILAQGCWESSGSYDCEKNYCVANSKTSKALKDTYFCCCNENFCNERVSHRYEDIIIPEVKPTEVVKYVEESYLLVVITLVILILIIITAVFMRKDFKKKTDLNVKGMKDSFNLMESGDPYISNFTVDNLILESIIGQGRYGAVWKGTVGEQQVAVKIFPSHHKNYFYNELDIYCLPFMTHPSLLSYFGYDERTNFDGNTEHFLFLSLAPRGCVQDYLRGNVLDWDTFCKMSLSIARGVAYLHTDVQKGAVGFMSCKDHCKVNVLENGVLSKFNFREGINFPVVVLKSHTVRISLYMQRFPSSFHNPVPQCMNVVRYHSYFSDKSKPCVTHRDLNTKNILVKEDLSCVICDLGFATKISGSKYYLNGEERHAETKSINDVGTLRYMSPEVLEGAVNLHDCETSLKQIDVYALGLVLWEISSRCSDFYPAGVECGPYRLPFEAEIGHPSFEQMQILVCRHKARPLFPDLWRDTPAIRTIKETIEDCWDQDAEARLTALCVEERFHELSGLNDRQKSVIYSNGRSPYARTSLVQRESQNILVNDSKEGDSCVSESTVETLLAPSPANPLVHYKNSNQQQTPCPSLQPYQGRNPCLERNLMAPQNVDSNSDELIDKSQKHIGGNTDLCSAVNDYMNLYVANSTQNFTNPSYASYSAHSEPITRSHVPIPFVQNMNADNSCQFPKQSNISKSAVNSKSAIWKNFLKIFDNKRKGNDISPQVDCNANSNLIVNESGDTLSTPTAAMEVTMTNGKLETKVARQDIEKLTNQLKSTTETCTGKETVLKGGQNVRRPNTLDLPFIYSNNNHHSDKSLKNIEKSKRRQSPMKVIKRYSLNVNHLYEKGDRQVKTKSLSEIEELDKKSLLDNEKDAEEMPKENDVQCQKKSLDAIFRMESKDELKLKDPNQRIKTPGDVPLAVRKLRGERNTARFSLYDDRIMSGYYENETLYSCENGQAKNEIHVLKSLEDIKFSQNI